MAHAAFPLAVPLRAPVLGIDARRRLRTLGLPLALGLAVVTGATAGLVHLDVEAARLAAAVEARESANLGLADDIVAAHRARAIAAIRAADVKTVLADQLTALESRDGFLP